MKPQTVDKLIWALLYGGLIGIALGLSLRTGDAALGWVFIAGGSVASAIGAALVYVRSRMKDPAGDRK
jgi:cyanate permease